MRNLLLALSISLVAPFSILAQQIEGTILDKDGPIPRAEISVANVGGTTSDNNGNFKLKVPAGSHDVTISFIGYITQKLKVSVKSGEIQSLNVTLEKNVELLDAMVIVGTRSRSRSSINSAVPVDVLSVDKLLESGQNSFDKALTYTVPSFNSVQTPVNDATSLLDPYEIRNMGPSRTLILVNGKRKNLSALLYTQTSPGRGETGADISGIPIDAIERVEILRDGASAHYGSDAIAGVMNIILKDKADHGSFTIRTGITGQGDGQSIGLSLNNGSTLGESGFINYTAEFARTKLANRPGTVDAEGEATDFGADIDVVREFLSRRPDAGNINGSPENMAGKFMVNGGFDLNPSTQLYFNSGYIYKNINSFANYRTPYWRTLNDYPYLSNFFPAAGTAGNYDGYLPTFDGILRDHHATVGFKSQKNEWSYDISFTTGSNSQAYTIRNTHNGNYVYSPSTWLDANGNGVIDNGELTEGSQLYRENSPTQFDPGGSRFSHNVGNIDISRRITDRLSLGFGTEFRSETFEIIEGEQASYEGGGSDSFAGNRPENSGKFNRYNIGGYLDLGWDVTDEFLLDGTIRLENYSDFGDAFVWKVSSRYKVSGNKLILRSSISNGFRAPTLHQIYTQRAQYSFVPGSGIQVGGLVNNVSPQAQLLGIPALDAEKSTNFTVGFGTKPTKNLSLTADYYRIAVRDRIVLSTEIGPSTNGGTALDQILADNNLTDVSFFINALNTITSGIDVVASYGNVSVGGGDMEFTLSGNYTIQNERDGDVNNPPLVSGAGQSVVNETQEALFFTSRPRTKWILGIDYHIGKFDFALGNTYFGKTEFRQQGMSSDLKTEFIPKIVTDLTITYSLNQKLSMTFSANNLLNVLPEWKFVALNEGGESLLSDPDQVKQQSNLITFNQRYSQMTYNGFHFSQLGSLFSFSVRVRI